MIDFLPFITFVVITSVTPGPNNISAMAFSMQQGYRKTLPYILGISSGSFVIFMMCAFMAFGLKAVLPQIVVYTKYIGAAYILFLAYKTMRMNLLAENKREIKTRIVDGALLQLVNPKGMFFGLTVYSTFLSPLVDYPHWLVLSAFGFALNVILNVSVWALFGALIQKFLKNILIKRIFTIVMVGGLVYTAIDIILS